VFSKPGSPKGYSMISGQDFHQGYVMDKKKLDHTMLEVMNAF
jgi:multiple sugar transport system ATP-binding protein